MDFEEQFPGKKSLLYNEWPKFSENIRIIALKKATRRN